MRLRILSGLLFGLLAVLGMVGCEAVLGTSDLVDRGADSVDATTPDGDDGDDVGEDASLDASRTDARSGSEAGSSEGGSSEASAPTSASCAHSNARYSCGASQQDDCCAVDQVDSGGSYERTYEAGASGSNGDSDNAVISGFALDRYEVTVGRFREYVSYLEDGGMPPDDMSGIHTYLNTIFPEGPGLLIDPQEPFFEQGWSMTDDSRIPQGASAGDTWAAGTCTSTYTSTPADAENVPMTCLTWFEAYAFCIWDGGYLPSEGEWEFAAAGGGQERKYPWGATDPGTARQYANFDCAPPECPAIVGQASSGAGAYGHFDLMGNVAEWTADDFFPYDDPINEATICQDCLNYDDDGESNNSETKVARGGGYPYAITDNALYPPWRSSFGPSTRLPYLGVRCGRNPTP